MRAQDAPVAGAPPDELGGGGGGAGAPGGASSARPFACGASKSPMFQSQEPLNMRVSANFTRLNSAPTAEESGSEGTVELLDEPGEPIAAKVVARGNSRFRNCQVRPFSLKFPEKQKGNLFQHLGKSVKFVSHCVAKPGAGKIIQAPSIEAYEQRVVMEHTVYRLLDQLDAPSLKSRLVRLTYHDTETHEEQTNLAFVLEPEDEMAQRCGMDKSEDVELPEAGVPKNPEGVLLTYLLNNFILQYDWDLSEQKNLVELYDRTRNELFYAPYDFDLVSLFRLDYAPNHGRTIVENRAAFADWLRRNQSQALFREAGIIVDRADALRSAFEQEPALLASSRELFSSWFSNYLPALREFRACEGHHDDPARPECYVPDEHAAAIEKATPISLGQLTTAIEPPGDVDTFAVELAAGELYTLGGNARIDLLDGGETLASVEVGELPKSLFAPRSGPFFVRASLGDRLVVSGWHGRGERSERPVFLYADDAGASLDTARRVLAGQPRDGKWELTGGEDHDLYLVRAEPATTLHVTFEEEWSFGYAEVIPVDAPPDALPAEHDLSAGDNDLSASLREPGEYLVKLNQLSGSPGASTYTIELK